MAIGSRIVRDGGASRSGSEATPLGSGRNGEGLEIELLVELAGAGLERGVEQLVEQDVGRPGKTVQNGPVILQ